MKSPEPPLVSSGPTLVNPEKQPSLDSPQPKTRSRKKQETATSPLPNGLENSNPKKRSAPESEHSLPPKANEPSLLSVPKPLPKPRDRASEALKRLGVDPLTLRSAPEITPMLKNAEGGLKAVLGAMRFCAEDPSIALFLEKYDSTPVGDRDKLSWEAIALAAGLDLRVFLGAAMLALQSHAVNTVKIIAMTSHPKITRARVKYGLLPSGEKDRTALDTAMGFLPSPKGPTFIGKAIFGSGGNNPNAPIPLKEDEEDESEEEGAFIDADTIDIEKLFPSSNTIQQKLIPIRQRMLEGGK
ncbi:unnamed protein product [Sphagnum balticum]